MPSFSCYTMLFYSFTLFSYPIIPSLAWFLAKHVFLKLSGPEVLKKVQPWINSALQCVLYWTNPITNCNLGLARSIGRLLREYAPRPFYLPIACWLVEIVFSVTKQRKARQHLVMCVQQTWSGPCVTSYATKNWRETSRQQTLTEPLQRSSELLAGYEKVFPNFITLNDQAWSVTENVRFHSLVDYFQPVCTLPSSTNTSECSPSIINERCWKVLKMVKYCINTCQIHEFYNRWSPTHLPKPSKWRYIQRWYCQQSELWSTSGEYHLKSTTTGPDRDLCNLLRNQWTAGIDILPETGFSWYLIPFTAHGDPYLLIFGPD